MGKAVKKSSVDITRDSLRQFEPISSLSNERLDELVSLSYVETINMGVSLFREGDVDNQTIYVLKGDVQLNSSSDNKELTIRSNAKDARFPLDDCQPRQYSAVAMSLVEIVRIDNSVLDYMMMWDQLAVAEMTNPSTAERSSNTKTEGSSKIDSEDEVDVENIVKQAVLDSIKNANGIDAIEKVDFNKTIKPELAVNKPKEKTAKTKIDTIESKNVSIKQKKPKTDSSTKQQSTTQATDSHANKETAVDSKSATTINEAIKDQADSPDVIRERIEVSAKKSNQEENSIVYDSRDWIRKIRKIMAFKNMPPANIKKLLGKMESISVKDGDKIIEQGDIGDYYYIVTDGSAIVTRTIELATLSAGTSFGEEALVAKSPRNASVSMTSDGMLMRLSKKDFDELLIEPYMARVSPEEARSKILHGAKWLDVRHAKEFHHSRLAGAINIPLHELRLRMTELDTETEYICCCRTGARSSSGAFLLAQNGFKVSLLTGGIQVMPQDLRR